MAGSAQIDGTAFDPITRSICFVFLLWMPHARHQKMFADPIHLTAAQVTRWHSLNLYLKMSDVNRSRCLHETLPILAFIYCPCAIL
jgi:hypothetical protein